MQQQFAAKCWRAAYSGTSGAGAPHRTRLFHFHRVLRRNDEACICDKVKRGELFQSGFERFVRMRICVQRNPSRIEPFACA
jgi:hypothetical protein